LVVEPPVPVNRVAATLHTRELERLHAPAVHVCHSSLDVAVIQASSDLLHSSYSMNTFDSNVMTTSI
jgi:hypothetical protein